MSTRQFRLSGPEQITRKLPQFKGSNIHVVLTDNTVMVGELLDTDNTMVVIKNKRLKKMSLPTNRIVEIYFDAKDTGTNFKP